MRPPALRRLLVAVGILLIPTLMLRSGLSSIEAALLYFPLPHHISRPPLVGLAGEDLWLDRPGGVRLHGWRLSLASPPSTEPRPVMVWFSGNGGNVSGNLENARRLMDELGVDVVMVDYRGYGQSGGRPTERDLYADGRAVLDLVRSSGTPPERTIIFGRSLGSAVAVDVALDREVGAVVLETPFLSLPTLARAVYPWIPTFLVQSRYDNETKLPLLQVPKLIIQAERDEVVPPAHARQLFDIAPAPKTFHTIQGARHNDTFRPQNPAYYAAWRSLLSSISPAS